MKQVYREYKRKKFKKIVTGCAAAAAAFTGGFFFLAANPAMAAKLPIIGHIFETMQDCFSYQGDFNSLATVLEESETETESGSLTVTENSPQGGVSQYSQTHDGLTMTLSEVYCNQQALYISFLMEAEQPFPEKTPNFQIKTAGNYSFIPEEVIDLPVLEGEFLDDSTYAGMFRFDLAETTGCYVSDKTSEIPDSFTLDLDISQIIGYFTSPDLPKKPESSKEEAAMSDEEWNQYMLEWFQQYPELNQYPNRYEHFWYDGPWSYTLDIHKDNSKTVTKEVNEMSDEYGVGISKVVKTPFEITFYDKYSDSEAQAKYIPVMLDAEGRSMAISHGAVNTSPIKGRDVSMVELFFCEYETFMNELKGAKWLEAGAVTDDGRAYRELLAEHCVFHTKVVFDE